MAFGPAVLDRHGFPRDKPSFGETTVETRDELGGPGLRQAAEKADHRRRVLLRARRERPCGSRATEQRDELAPLHRLPSSGWGALTLPHRWARMLLCVTAATLMQTAAKRQR
jgi:hypothetical protein